MLDTERLGGTNVYSRYKIYGSHTSLRRAWTKVGEPRGSVAQQLSAGEGVCEGRGARWRNGSPTILVWRVAWWLRTG